MKKLLSALLGIFGLFIVPAYAALPSGYTELQYIESTGTQYIDTGVKGNLETKAEIVYQIPNSAVGTQTWALFGARTTSNQKAFIGGTSNGQVDLSSSKMFTQFSSTANYPVNNVPYIDFDKHTMQLSKQGMYQDGVLVRSFNNMTAFDTDDNIALFAAYDATNRLSYGIWKVYSLQIYNNNTLVRNMVPAKNASGKIGMYDTVNDVFYENKGTGEFIAGSDVCNGTIVNYTSATGTGVQNGTPTPDNPIYPTFYKQGDMVLRKVGDIADSYDATTGKITRRVGEYIFTGRESIDVQYNVYGVTTIPYDMNKVTNASLCSHNKTYINSLVTNDRTFDKFLFFTNVNRVGFGVSDTPPEITNTETFKQWLAAQYAAGTPVTIYYPLETETTEDWPASQCTTEPIKIATTKYNESAFGPLNTALANAISVVDSVVSNTITQAASIATLQAQKQTRPADDTCPAYKQCLLVEDENGTPHWYEITDPFRDFVAPIIAQEISPNATGAVFDAGYTQLEYIESTGTQWIDTGVYLSSNHAVEFVANVGGDFFGTRSPTSGGASFGVTGRSTLDMYARTSEIKAGGRLEVENTGITTKYIYHIESGNKWMKNADDGTVLGRSTYVPNAFTISEYTAPIFNIAWSAPASERTPTKGKLYSFKIWENGTLVRNFIPVRKNEYGTIGMYDTVGGQFYGNAASSGDDFTAGPVVANDADVPVPQWIRAWDANAQYNLSAGEVYGTAQCNNLSGTQEHAQKATSAQMASSGWSENGAKCWCKVVGVELDNEYIEAPATASWVFDAVRPSVEDCNRMCAAACSNRVLGEAAFRKAVFGM